MASHDNSLQSHTDQTLSNIEVMETPSFGSTSQRLSIDGDLQSLRDISQSMRRIANAFRSMVLDEQAFASLGDFFDTIEAVLIRFGILITKFERFAVDIYPLDRDVDDSMEMLGPRRGYIFGYVDQIDEFFQDITPVVEGIRRVYNVAVSEFDVGPLIEAWWEDIQRRHVDFGQILAEWWRRLSSSFGESFEIMSLGESAREV